MFYRKNLPGWERAMRSRAIQSLPDHYREVILLRDIEEFSIDEIAGVLDLSRESVKARIHRARIMIREYLIRD
ncbi:MAG: sigma factor-like helix-turn-helix DNA-binding protein [Bradyrhizobium sp.]